MAAASGNRTIGTASGGRGGNGKGDGRFALGAKVVVGVALLGCVAALTIGGGRLRSTARAQPVARVAAQQVVVGGVLGPIGRTGPADEYQRGDFAGTRQVPQRNGPADEYTQSADLPIWTVTHGMGPADEYTQAEYASDSVMPDRFTYREDRGIR